MNTESLGPIVIGGAIALMASMLTQWWSHTLEVRRQRRSVAGAFAGEIDAICAVVRQRRYFDLLMEYQQLLRQGQMHTLVIPVTQDYFTVFQANATTLGSLPAQLALDTARFYTQLKALLEDVRPDGLRPATLEEAEWHTEQLISLLKDSVSLGDSLVERLREVAA